jgi:hypothetical protein
MDTLFIVAMTLTALSLISGIIYFATPNNLSVHKLAEHIFQPASGAGLILCLVTLFLLNKTEK